MSENMKMQLVDQLIEELGSYGISCDETKACLMVEHLLLVIEKNKVMNLTRIVESSEAVSLHLVDSLLPLACQNVELGKRDSFVDIGTGAGFPGIPLSIMTGATGLLIDSVGKKVAAVNEFIGQLGIEGVRAEHIRVEDLGKDVLGRQSHVFARAVAKTNVLLEYATPLLKKGGLLVLEKGNPDDEELVRGARAAKICGMEPVSRETFELPHEFGHREILVYRKVGKPSIKLPRQAGLAKREPLGE